MIKEFDDLFEYIGGFGLFQWILFAVVCYVNMLYAFCLYGQLFLTITPPHWCQADSSLEELHRMGFNLTEDELVHMSIPQLHNGQGYESCYKYNISIAEVLNGGISAPDPSWKVIECDTGWNYNFSSNYYPTFTSEYDFVCNEDWKPPLAQSIFFIGSIFGGPLFGWTADNYGRLPVAICSNILSGLAGLWSAFTHSFVPFCISRFLVGFATDTNYMIIFIVGMELVSADYRTYMANIPITIFLSGSLIVMPWISVAIANWRWLAMALSIPHLMILVLPLFFPESIRWLIDKGKYKKASRVIKKIAKINGKELTNQFDTEFESYFKKYQQEKQKIVNWWDLLKTPNLKKRFLLLCVMWVTIQVAYDGNVRNIETIGGNFFLSFTLIGIMEAPADILNIFTVEKFGRRYTVVFALIFCSVSSFVVAGLPRDGNWLSLLIFALAGRFFITLAANCGLQYVVEVLPTVARAQGVGVSHTLGCGMTLVTPYIVYMSKFSVWAPYTIVGLISLTGGIASLFLPETKGYSLPGTLVDGENAFSNQKFFYNPFASELQHAIKRRKSSEIDEAVL